MSAVRSSVDGVTATPAPEPGRGPPGDARGRRLRAWAPFLTLVIVLVAVWGLSSPLWIDVANLVMIAAIAAIGLDLLLGHTGLISVGNAALLGIGAFGVALVNRAMEVPFLLAVLLSGVVCGLVGIVVALPSLRITGLYLAIATLGFHFVAIWGLRELQTALVGDSGFVVPVANLFGYEIVALYDWFAVLAVFLLVTVLLYRTLIRHKPGRALHAIRERPALAAMSGIPVTGTKVTAFVVSSFLVGIAGGLSAYYIGHVSYADFGSLHIAIEYLAMVILGGLGSTYGPILGAAVIVSLPHLIQTARTSLELAEVVASTQLFLVQGAAVGLVVAFIVIVQPRGLVGVGHALLAWRARGG